MPIGGSPPSVRPAARRADRRGRRRAPPRAPAADASPAAGRGRTPRPVRAGRSGRPDHRGAAAVAAAARRQLLLHRRRRAQRDAGRPRQLRRAVRRPAVPDRAAQRRAAGAAASGRGGDPGPARDVHLPAGARAPVLPQRLLLPGRALPGDRRRDLQPAARPSTARSTPSSAASGSARWTGSATRTSPCSPWSACTSGRRSGWPWWSSSPASPRWTPRCWTPPGSDGASLPQVDLARDHPGPVPHHPVRLRDHDDRDADVDVRPALRDDQRRPGRLDLPAGVLHLDPAGPDEPPGARLGRVDGALPRHARRRARADQRCCAGPGGRTDARRPDEPVADRRPDDGCSRWRRSTRCCSPPTSR